MNLQEAPINVEISTHHIAIYDEGNELVRWTRDEWENDPGIIPAICNAIKLAYENPRDLRDRLSNDPISREWENHR